MDRKETYFFVLLLLLFSVLTITSAKAERVEPTGRDTPVTATFDKSSVPSQVDIWKNESGGYDTSYTGLWGRNSWLCVSNSSPTNGQCATSPQWYGYGHTQVQLEFIEQRSGITQVINITAYHKSAQYDDLLSTAAAYWDGAYETKETAYIPSSELQKLPVGGIWKAELKMSLTQWDPRTKLADWNAHITLNVTDNNNQQIYLPEFGQAAPRVDLNLRPLPGTRGNQTQMTGSANIDMCVYDGYGANSSQLTVKFDDIARSPAERGNNVFSLYTDTGNTNIDSGRIDYHVTMQWSNDRKLDVIRGVENSMANAQLLAARQVHLPGIPQPVLCTPIPVTLTAEEFNIDSKQAGH